MTEAQYRRETAHRVFAQEFRDSRHTIQGEGERDPSYVLSPLGAKVNRVHVVGVCTDVEPIGESGDQFRARISDPTGVFTVYAGQYQPEAQRALGELTELPCFLAVTGKARTYEPEEGSVFVSIRPESVTAVDAATRDQWILETARRTKDRIVALGEDSEAARLTAEHYDGADTARYKQAAVEALHALVGGDVPVHRIESRDEDEGAFAPQAEAPQWTPPPAAEKKDPEAEAAHDALDDAIFQVVDRQQGDNGAQWEDIVTAAKGEGHTSEEVEESLNRLMDKGLVYEPTLGVLKRT